jgi:hypothetical protein
LEIQRIIHTFTQMKAKKHDKIVNDYQKEKAKHLEKLATRLLENDEKVRKFKEKKTDGKFLDLF